MTQTSQSAPPHNFVGGSWRPSHAGQTYEKRSPWEPSLITGTFAASDAEDVREAVEAARSAFERWSRLPATGRALVLLKAAEAVETRGEVIARDMTAEMGKPLREARMEAARGAAILRYAAGEALRPAGEIFEPSVPNQMLYTRRRPLGVVGLITPWNFPLAIPVWKLAPALIYGNTVVLKVGDEAPRTGLHIAECFADAGLPEGVLNVLTGSGAAPGAELVAHPGVAAISFTGSVAVGKIVREVATARGCRVQLELGGQNPLIVAPDAELDRAVEGTFAGAFWSAGQKCTATRRVYVHASVYDAYRDKLLARIETAKVGDPADEDTEVGPVVTSAAMDQILSAIAQGTSDGGRIIAGGERIHEAAYLVAPTVIEDLPEDSRLTCEEVFGPVVSLFRYTTLDEALQRSNAVEYGLSAGVYTRDLHTAQRFADELEAGILHINSQTAGAEVHVPFGGLKGSAWGPHEQGRAAVEFYTQSVTVYQDSPLTAS